MSSSSKNDMSPGNATPAAGSTPPPAAPPFITAGFPGPPTYQGFAGQPFDENNDVYASFLPRKAGASATGLDQGMLNAIMGISPKGKGRVARGAADPNAPAADAPAAADAGLPWITLAPGTTAPQGWRVEGNKAQPPTIEAYTSALHNRDQLAGLMASMDNPRYNGGSSAGGPGGGGNYGSSGRSSGGRLA